MRFPTPPGSSRRPLLGNRRGSYLNQVEGCLGVSWGLPAAQPNPAAQGGRPPGTSPGLAMGRRALVQIEFGFQAQARMQTPVSLSRSTPSFAPSVLGLEEGREEATVGTPYGRPGVSGPFL